MLEERLLHVFTTLDIRWRRPPIPPAGQPTRMSLGGLSVLWTRECMHPLEHFSLLCVCLHNKNFQIKVECIHTSLRFITTQNTEVN